MSWETPHPGGLRLLRTRVGCADLAFTSRHRGASTGPYSSLDLAFHVGDDPHAVLANREAVMRVMGYDAAALTCADQVHGTAVVVVDEGLIGAGARAVSALQADALVTDLRGTPLAVMVADCVPVLLVDRSQPAVGVAHAGWKGVLGGVVPSAVGTMAEAFESNPRGLSVWIGPHIRRCCFEVGSDLLESFVRRFGPAADAGGGRLDLEACLMIQLGELEIPTGSVTSVGLCTACDMGTFFSYRRAMSGVTGRQMGIAVLTQ